MTLTALAAIGLAFSLDLLIGEPPNAVHPVAWLGRAIAPLDRDWSDDERTAKRIGVAIALLVPLAAGAIAAGAVLAAGTVGSMAAAITAAIVLFSTTSLRALLDLTREVLAATEGDLETARERVRGLVGRDASALSPAEIRSAAIESAAENLADGLVSTLLPFAALAPVSLPLAAGVAAWIKAVNTLDSMLGYPSKPHGTASARLDDLVMWLPARATAALLAIAAGDSLAASRAGRWARDPPSPNSGWPMGTLACALGVRLEKPGAYVLNPERGEPTPADGDRAVSVVGRAGALAVALAAVLAVVVPPIAESLLDGVVSAPETAADLLRALGRLVVDSIEAIVRAIVDLLRAILRGAVALLEAIVRAVSTLVDRIDRLGRAIVDRFRGVVG